MDAKLILWLASVTTDPYAFVMGAFPWGEPGTILEKYTGPEQWQVDVLKAMGEAITKGEPVKFAVASGRGIGKTTLEAWIILWSMSTSRDTLGKIAANTEPQLRTVVWPALGKWFNIFIAKDLFKMTATALFARENELTWRFDMATWSKENTEAFQGMHNKDRRMVVLFDEASGIPDNVWEVTEGSMTDKSTQLIWCAFSNPTKNTGRFRECFPGQKHGKYWKTWQIDSREVSISDHRLFNQWIETYGEDSDFVRIHIRGTFPRRGEMEFISSADVSSAALAEPFSNRTDPLVLGVDVARFGDNETVLFFRKGRDARSIPPIRLRGVDTVGVAARVAEVVRQYHIDAVFVDGGGVGGGVVDNLRHLHIACFDINFGSKPDGVGFATGDEGTRYANKRAEMWGSLRAWLRGGAIPDDPDLRAQLVGPTYTLNLRNEIQLERKEDMVKRGLESPDLADALALTFAYPVASHADAGHEGPHEPLVQSEYDPFSAERMAA